MPETIPLARAGPKYCEQLSGQDRFGANDSRTAKVFGDFGESMSKGGKGGKQAANNRSNSMNPNNAAHGAASNNRSNQLNPTSPAYKSSRASSTGMGTSRGGGSTSLPGWTARPGCDLCENKGPHDGPHGYFTEGDFYPFEDGIPDVDEDV